MSDFIDDNRQLTAHLGWKEAPIDAAGTAALSIAGGFFSFEERDSHSGLWTSPRERVGFASGFRLTMGKPNDEGIEFSTLEGEYPFPTPAVDAFKDAHGDVFTDANAARVARRWRAIDELYLDGRGDEEVLQADVRDVGFRDYEDHSQDDDDDDVVEEDGPDDSDVDADGAEHTLPDQFPRDGGREACVEAEREGDRDLDEGSILRDKSPRRVLRATTVALDEGAAGERECEPARFQSVLMESAWKDVPGMHTRFQEVMAEDAGGDGVAPIIHHVRRQIPWASQVDAIALQKVITDEVSKIEIVARSNDQAHPAERTIPNVSPDAAYVSQVFPDGSRHCGIERQGRRDGFWVAIAENGIRREIGSYQKGVKSGPWLQLDGNQQVEAKASYLMGLRQADRAKPARAASPSVQQKF